MYKTVEEVVEKLSARVSDDMLLTVTKGGGDFSYIPWEKVVRILDETFGPFGWSTAPVSFEGHPKEGVYLAAAVLTARALDGDKVVELSRAGFGRAVAMPARSEGDVMVSHNLAIHDTAASAAGTDAIVKATKLLGDAFGLFLYEKKQGANSGASSAKSGSNGAKGGDTRPSDKQLGVLTKNGYAEDEVDAMPYKQWKPILDAIFDAYKAGKKYVRPGKGGAKTTKKSFVDEDDDDEEADY